MTRVAKFWAKVQVYQSKSRFYARLVYGYGAMVEGFRHIPGGAAVNPLVKERRRLLKRAIDSGASLGQILGLIDKWRDGVQ